MGFNENKRTKYNICSSSGASMKDLIINFVQIGGFDSSLLHFGLKKIGDSIFKTKLLQHSNK